MSNAAKPRLPRVRLPPPNFLPSQTVPTTNLISKWLIEQERGASLKKSEQTERPGALLLTSYVATCKLPPSNQPPQEHTHTHIQCTICFGSPAGPGPTASGIVWSCSPLPGVSHRHGGSSLKKHSGGKQQVKTH